MRKQRTKRCPLCKGAGTISVLDDAENAILAMFSKRLIALMKKCNVSHQLLADECDVTINATHQWTSQQQMPSVHKMLKIASVFGCSLDSLLNGST